MTDKIRKKYPGKIISGFGMRDIDYRGGLGERDGSDFLNSAIAAIALLKSSPTPSLLPVIFNNAAFKCCLIGLPSGINCIALPKESVQSSLFSILLNAPVKCLTTLPISKPPFLSV